MVLSWAAFTAILGRTQPAGWTPHCPAGGDQVGLCAKCRHNPTHTVSPCSNSSHQPPSHTCFQSSSPKVVYFYSSAHLSAPCTRGGHLAAFTFVSQHLAHCLASGSPSASRWVGQSLTVSPDTQQMMWRVLSPPPLHQVAGSEGPGSPPMLWANVSSRNRLLAICLPFTSISGEGLHYVFNKHSTNE